MDQENNNYIEKFIKKLCKQKKRMFSFIIGLLCIIFSMIYLTSVKTSGVMSFYQFCLILAAAANVFYVTDVEDKNKNAPDVLVIGIMVVLLGMLVRTVHLGILFSWSYCITYAVFSVCILLLLTKHVKNQGDDKLIFGFAVLMALYSIFEIIRISSMAHIVVFSWCYYRLAEVMLFLNYALILKLNQDKFETFGERLGSYRLQIPSLRIMMLILAFVAVVSLGIGAIAEFGSKKTVVKSLPVTVDTNENKSSGTVSTTTNETVNTQTGTVSTPVPSPTTQPIVANETVVTEDYEFTLNRAEFSYRVEPDAPPRWYTYYDAPDNQVYLYMNVSIKNTQKQTLPCDEIYSVTVDYNGGYTYRGFHIADDTDGDFTYANITSVEPLQTLGVHCLVACPEEAETSEYPMFATITMKDGSKYQYTIR